MLAPRDDEEESVAAAGLSTRNLGLRGRVSSVRSFLCRCHRSLRPPPHEGVFCLPAGGKRPVPRIGIRKPDVVRPGGGGPVPHNRRPPHRAAMPCPVLARCDAVRTFHRSVPLLLCALAVIAGSLRSGSGSARP